MSEMNIYEKMLAIQTELQTVAKNLSVSTGKNSYKAVSERDVIDAVKPLENKYRVYSYPSERKILESEFLERQTTNGTTKSFYLRVEVVYKFVNIDKPDEVITVVGYGDGIDTGDKATGKAMTYADKYALMKAYKISTGDDPDKDASETYDKKTDDKLFKDIIDCHNKLGHYEVDRRNSDVIMYINNKAGTNFSNLDVQTLMDSPKDAKKVIKVMRSIIEKKASESLDVNDEKPTF